MQELKKIWQQKLSALHVAQFPWDSPLPQDVLLTVGGPAPPLSSTSSRENKQGSAADQPKIKREDSVPAGANSTTTAGNNGGLFLPGGGKIAQTDGPSGGVFTISEEGINNKTSHSRIRALDSLTPREVDGIIETSISQGRIPGGPSQEQGGMSSLEIEIPPHLLRRLQKQQVDGAGGDDDDDDDSDGINSDLDDSDDDEGSGREDDDSESSMMMLCLYDKVQRVKNKWKYVLKDGVANINGRDYVFNKANVESEW